MKVFLTHSVCRVLDSTFQGLDQNLMLREGAINGTGRERKHGIHLEPAPCMRGLSPLAFCEIQSTAKQVALKAITALEFGGQDAIANLHRLRNQSAPKSVFKFLLNRWTRWSLPSTISTIVTREDCVLLCFVHERHTHCSYTQAGPQ